MPTCSVCRPPNIIHPIPFKFDAAHPEGQLGRLGQHPVPPVPPVPPVVVRPHINR
jgi:hypothetical protein